MSIVDVSSLLTVTDIECCQCPFCDNEMQEYEQVTIVSVHGSLALAHSVCIAQKRTEMEE